MGYVVERIRARLARHGATWRRIVVGLVALIFCVQWAHIAARPRGDFHLHWEFGRRLAAGEFIYGNNLNCSYPPFWALAHAPLTVLPLPAAQAVLFPLCAVALAVLLWSLSDVLREHFPAPRPVVFWSAALALGLASRFLVRDMLECGVNLALVAAAWAAVALWRRGRDGTAGVVLGTAIALKCTPALFCAWFLWKRQWKVAAVTAATAGVLTLSPALVMGGREYARALDYWVTHASQGTGLDPSQGVLGEEPLQNMSLRAALGRWLVQLPKGHEGRVEHPLALNGLGLPPAAAGWIVLAVTLLVVGWIGWAFRRPANDRRSLAMVWEATAVSLLILLLSPITWGQHCVGVLPVMYVLARANRAGVPIPAWVRGTVIVYAVLILGLNRELLGQKLSWVLDSYGVTTWCVAALLAVAMRCRATAAMGAAASRTGVPSPAMATAPAGRRIEPAHSPVPAGSRRYESAGTRPAASPAVSARPPARR